MKELEIRNRNRRASKDFVEELDKIINDCREDLKNVNHLFVIGQIDEEDKTTRGFVNKIYIELTSVYRTRAKKTLLSKTPFALAFVYHPNGEILLKGFYEDVRLYMEEHFPVCIYRLITFHSQLRITSKGLTNSTANWFGTSSIRIHKPVSPKVADKSYHSRNGENKATLRKWRIDIAAKTFYFKRMPNRWLPVFTEALKEIEPKNI